MSNERACLVEYLLVGLDAREAARERLSASFHRRRRSLIYARYSGGGGGGGSDCVCVRVGVSDGRALGVAEHGLAGGDVVVARWLLLLLLLLDIFDGNVFHVGTSSWMLMLQTISQSERLT